VNFNDFEETVRILRKERKNYFMHGWVIIIILCVCLKGGVYCELAVAEYRHEDVYKQLKKEKAQQSMS
jgi:hypothetical protein